MWTPDAEIGGQPAHRVERVVPERERSVRAHVAAPTGPQEAFVLGQSGLGAVGAVAVGHLITAAHPHTDLGARGSHFSRTSESAFS